MGSGARLTLHILYITAFLSTTILAQSDWTLRHPVPTSNNLNGIIWTGTKYIAVAACGTVVTSSDGVDWKHIPTGSQYTLTSIAWSGTKYVAVGEYQYKGIILTSQDGLTWAIQDSSDNALYSITWTGNQFVTVGFFGTILTSPDGITWTKQPTGFHLKLSSVFYANNMLLALGDSMTIFSSSDGRTWSQRYRRNIFWGSFSTVYWTGKQFFVMGGYDSILTSEDGITWKGYHSNYNDFSSTSFSVTWFDSMFVAAGHWGLIITSTDGINWVQQESGTDISFNAIIAANSHMMAVGNYGAIFSSSDGKKWKSCKKGTDADLYSVVWNGTRLVAVGDSSTVMYSSNGIEWIETKALNDNAGLRCVIWAGTQFVAVGECGDIVTSPDGIIWKKQESEVADRLESVVWTGNQLVAVGNCRAILTSPDGITWTKREAEYGDWLKSVVWNGQRILIADFFQTVLSSLDGVTWELWGSGTNYENRFVTWAFGRYISAGETHMQTSIFLESTDGVNWINIDTLLNVWDVQLYIAGAGGGLISVGEKGSIHFSSDVYTWERKVSPTERILNGATFTGTQYVVVGEHGTILTSLPDNIAIKENQHSNKKSNTVDLKMHGSMVSLTFPTYLHKSMLAIAVFSLSGRKLAERKSIQGSTGFRWNAKTLAPGRYFLVVYDNQSKIVKQFSIVR